MILTGGFEKGDAVEVDYDGTDFVFNKKSRPRSSLQGKESTPADGAGIEDVEIEDAEVIEETTTYTCHCWTG